MTRPVMLSVAPNGARRSRTEVPHLPLTPEELARTAAECLAEGASLLHVHVRDEEGRHLLDADAYRQVFQAIRREVGDGLILQATTEAASVYHASEQRQLLRDLQPEAASVSVREFCADGDERANAELFAWAWTRGMLMQFIVYDDVDRERLENWCTTGVIPSPPRWTLHVLGQYQPARDAQPEEVARLAPHLADPWVMCAFGSQERHCLETALRLGGHVRIGFENNVIDAGGRPALSNAAQMRQLRSPLAELGAVPVDAGWLREHWHMND